MTSAKQTEKWAKTRQIGRRRFIWIYGVLGWGITTAIIYSVIMAAVQGWDRLAFYLPLSLILIPIGGIFWGMWMWKWSEARYQAAMRDQTIEKH